jgi:carboxyl-terminal processing protease
MNRLRLFLPTLFIILGLLLSACSGLIPLQEDAVSGDYGSDSSPQEHQMRTFEVLWKDIQNSYIHFEDADVDWESVHDQYAQKIDSGLTDEEFTALIKDLQDSLPPGTIVYQSRPERLEADLSDATTYDGIGAFVGFQEGETPHIVILAVIAGSPAEQAGLKAHDSVFSIDGDPVLLEEGLSVVNRIRGPAGSSVTLNVQSPGKPPRTVDVERARLTSTGKLESAIVPGTNYGYILFPPIGYTGLDQDVFNSLQSLAGKGTLDGLILDLRIANSSSNWPLDTLFTMFHNGEIGELYNRDKAQSMQVKGQDVVGSQTVPLVILVGKNTNGFAEIFAASLQMYKRAVVVGQQTPGQVETQSAFYLPDGSRVFVESTSFRLSNGDEIGNTGVTPDISVQAGWDEVLPNDDPVLKRAIESLGSPK